ncbi:MAG: HNH endonuclease [Longicatena sp.]
MFENDKYRPSHLQIVNYWIDKYITPSFEISSEYKCGYEPIINDLGKPKCWACGFLNVHIYDNPKYRKLLESRNQPRVWNLPESQSILQRAHIVPKMLNGGNDVSNYFLLCKHCHQESPDFLDSRFFYAYILYTRRHSCSVHSRREFEVVRAIYELALQMNKNILTLYKTKDYISRAFDKIGLHNTNISIYTIAAAIADGLDDLNWESISDNMKEDIKKEFRIYGIDFDKEMKMKFLREECERDN